MRQRLEEAREKGGREGVGSERQKVSCSGCRATKRVEGERRGRGNDKKGRKRKEEERKRRSEAGAERERRRRKSENIQFLECGG